MNADIKALLSYDPETGIFRNRVTRNNNGSKAGEMAGTLDKDGYICIAVHGKKYRAHRLAWFFVHGDWPSFDVDHINRVKADNRICNLRDVPRSTNLLNQGRPQRHNTTGRLGVGPYKGRYRARIQIQGRGLHIGVFDTAEEAERAYLSAKQSIAMRGEA